MRDAVTEKKLAVVSFTPGGQQQADRVWQLFREPLDGQTWQVCRVHKPEHLKEWCREQFAVCDAILFVGAMGIAVRTIAPFLKSKLTDPAVLVMDEKGTHVISVLSGHMGGGNELAMLLARGLKAEPVITTASDVNQKIAIDVFAKKNRLVITDMKQAARTAAAIVAGKPVSFSCTGKVLGQLPKELSAAPEQAEVKVIVSPYVMKDQSDMEMQSGMELQSGTENQPDLGMQPGIEDQPGTESQPGMGIQSGTESQPGMEIQPAMESRQKMAPCQILQLIPKAFVLGIGCRKGKTLEEIEARVLEELKQHGIPMESICAAASIDLKQEEKGLLDFCKKYHLPTAFYTAEELMQVPGEYKASEFVKNIAGVDNVCERAAVRYIRDENPHIVIAKSGRDGVTVALAEREWSVEFE